MFSIVISWDKAQDALDFLGDLEGGGVTAQDALLYKIREAVCTATISVDPADRECIEIELSTPQIITLARILAR